MTSAKSKLRTSLDRVILNHTTIVNARSLPEKDHLKRNHYAYIQVKAPKIKYETGNCGIIYTVLTNKKHINTY